MAALVELVREYYSGQHSDSDNPPDSRSRLDSSSPGHDCSCRLEMAPPGRLDLTFQFGCNPDTIVRSIDFRCR